MHKHLTLTKHDLEKAIAQYLREHVFPSVNVNTNDIQGLPEKIVMSCGENFVNLQNIRDLNADNNFKLRHRETKLLVEQYRFDYTEKAVIFGLGTTGRKWKSINSMLRDFRSTISSSYGDEAVMKLKDDLLNYEILSFGYISAEEMTFHIDELAAI